MAFNNEFTQVEYTLPPASQASVSQVLPLASGTCNLTFGGTTTDPTATYNTDYPSEWQRFGNIVRIRGRISVTAVTVAGSGSMVLRGLPFPVRTPSRPGGGGNFQRNGTSSALTIFVFETTSDNNMYCGTIAGSTGASSLGAGTCFFSLEYPI